MTGKIEIPHREFNVIVSYIQKDDKKFNFILTIFYFKNSLISLSNNTTTFKNNLIDIGLVLS